MANLRIISITFIDSSNISAKFSDNLSKLISDENIVITSETPGVPVPEILSINIVDNILNIKTQPMTSLAAYYITFQSTTTVPFKSLNGNAFLLNDGITNKQLVIAPVEQTNPVREYLTNFLRNNNYNIEDPSVISKYIQGISTVLSKSLYDIKQSKNENYLSFDVVDEIKTRGAGPFDRLNEESVYEVVRVGKTKTSVGTPSTSSNLFSSFPISLQSTNYIEDLTVNSNNKKGTFNLNDFTLHLNKSNVIKLNSITFVYNSVYVPYVYDIEKYGYQILNSKYDLNFAFTYLQLNSNELKLNDKILGDPLFSSERISRIEVSYQYKNVGKIIDPTSISIDALLASGREVIPPIENIFSTKKAPIVSSSNTIPSTGKITFIDPNAFPATEKHPAFLFEIPFRLDYIPSRAGEYAVDYSSGKVYVFGQDTKKTGTGEYPPLASYLYRYTFKEDIDYVVDGSDIVALPNGSLIDTTATINYNFEQLLSEGEDFKASTHLEALNERIENRLVALNAIQPKNFPITNVFRIYNETTGEIYSTSRWTDSKIYFNYVKPPRIEDATGERATFENVLNETLFVSSITEISPTQTIFKIFLNNNNVIAASEDCIGSYINSSVNFSNTNIFVQEYYWENNFSEDQNFTRLQENGDYFVDYVNGVVYCLVEASQDFSIGSVSYKRGYIVPENPHIITTDDIYNRFSVLEEKRKSFEYVSFGEGFILPSSFDVSNEGFLSENVPYQISNSQIGTFTPSFSAGVLNDVKFVRGVFEYDDLLNNKLPINFTTVSSNGKTIEVSALEFKEYNSVSYDGYDYFVLVNTPLFYLSPNITLTISVKRLSDDAELYNSSGIEYGNQLKIKVDNNSPVAGNSVVVNYSFEINDLSRVIVDYNKGDLFIDYSYLADEILISYEYGDNVLDFRQSSALNEGDQYFVSYRVGALRSALLKNFGSLIDIPILNSLDVSFERERYRDALMAALQSFTAGPTVASLNNIVNKIVHTPPEITETAFQNWSLGSGLLVREKISTSGEFSLVPAKYGNGVLVNNEDQKISFPVVSNLRLEQGSLGCWVIPNWNGIDNQSSLTFSITKNNTPINANRIFIGASAYHPELDGYEFTINYNQNSFGAPNKSKDGVFIYLKQIGDITRWFVDVIDGYADGYANKNYVISVSTDGKFYDVKSNQISKPSTDKIFSGNNSVKYTITGTPTVDQGITFVADYQHFLFDFGDADKNRFSIFKDESGYLNFRIIDDNKNKYTVSSDISDWKSGEQHYVSTAWSLSTKNNQDEMHLFIDGFEVSNIIKYNSKIAPYFHEKFRTIDPEEIIGIVDNAIVGSNDLTTVFGSSSVASSTINFSSYGIVAGATIFIEEVGFSTPGYTVLVVNGNTLTLSATMPLSMTNARFSVNKTSFTVSTEIDLYKNIAVSLLHSVLDGYVSTTSGSEIVSSATNFEDNDVVAGNLLQIDGYSSHFIIVDVSGTTLTLDKEVPTTSTSQFWVYSVDGEEEIPGVRALRPAYEISRDGYNVVSLTLKDKVQPNDIVFIKTLGLNHKEIKEKYFVWGDTSNVIKTRLPAPILLEDVEINHILLDGYIVGPSTATYSSTFTSTILTDQPSNSTNGRTLSVKLSGTNIDYSVPATVLITGTVGGIPSSTETLTFTENEAQSTTSKFETIDDIVVDAKPFDSNKDCVVVYVKELYPITVAENSSIVPTIRYSYQIFAGNSLSGSGTTISDDNGFFSVETINSYLIISYPPSVAGQYQIIAVADDHKSATISSSLPSFTGGIYEILNTTTFRSGLQNGFFTFEQDVGEPYLLVQGLYEFNYNTYLSIPIKLDKKTAYIGTDINGENHINATIDEFNILSERISDTRVGETISIGQESFTKNFNSLKALTAKANTLMLLDFDIFPFVSDADVYTTATKKFIQSSFSVNDNFDKSICITRDPVIIDNNGILNTKKEGSIEFWVSPLYDTGNDPNYRFYFDASSLVSEEITTDSNAFVSLTGRAASVLSVKTNDKKLDYFAGGSISSDGQTLFLNKKLPNKNTKVVVNYIPTGTSGDRISIYKDPVGYINFDVRASGTDYQVRAPAFWTKGSWHRIKAQYKFNSGLGSDQIRFFVDGYERGNILFGSGLLFGQSQVFGSSFIGPNTMSSSIVFKDNINEIFIGSDYTGSNNGYALIDNLRISNVFRPIFSPFGEPIDVNWSSNIDAVFPVTEDLYTTFLMDFNTLVYKTTDFAILKNKKTGLFNILINVFDEFDIVKSNIKVKNVLEEILNHLKPANSKLYIKYFD